MDSGGQQHRDVGRRRVTLQNLADAKPVDSPQQQVQDDGIGDFLPGAIERFQPVLGADHAEALTLEPLTNDAEPLRVIVGDKDPAAATRCWKRRCRPRFAHATFASIGSRGMRNRKALPAPAADSTQI